MKKNTKKLPKRNYNRYIAAALEWIFDECLLDVVNEHIANFAKDNQNEVKKIDWSHVSPEKILDDKEFRKSLLGTIQGCIEELQADQAGELVDRVNTSLSDYESQTGIHPSKKLIMDVIKEFNYNNLPKKCMKDVYEDICS